MTIQEIFAQAGPIAHEARSFVEAAAKFMEVLAANNLTLDLGVTDNTDSEIDYDAPTEDSYKKSYRPITATEIIQANKQMTEAISGEKWVAGFIACVQLMMLFAGAA